MSAPATQGGHNKWSYSPLLFSCVYNNNNNYYY